MGHDHNGHRGRHHHGPEGHHEMYLQHHPGRGPWEEFGGGRGRHGGGHGGPPPWLGGLFGDGGRGRGPRVRRGDVRSAIIDVLRTESAEAGEPGLNGYQVIQKIAERSQGAWQPSPGSVYPTLQQLEDEGLITGDEGRGRRSLRLSPEGETYAAEHADELAAVWTPFEEGTQEERPGADVRREIGQVMNAVWNIVSTGTEAQRTAAVEVLVEARRKLYGILAEGA